MFLNVQIDLIILKTYDQQFTLTTKKSLLIIFNAWLYVSVINFRIIIIIIIIIKNNWIISTHHLLHHHTTSVLRPFSGTTQVSWCQKRTSGLYGAGKD